MIVRPRISTRTMRKMGSSGERFTAAGPSPRESAAQGGELWASVENRGRGGGRRYASAGMSTLRLRILSYNVRYFGHALRGLASTRTGKRDIASCIAVLAEAPHMICPQEVDTLS